MRPTAYMLDGARVAYWGPGEQEGCFEGELLNPRPNDIENGGTVSALWELAKVRWLSQPGKSNFFRMNVEGKLDLVFLRGCAVRRLFERGKIDATRAVELLKCDPKFRRAVVESWTNLEGDSA